MNNVATCQAAATYPQEDHVTLEHHTNFIWGNHSHYGNRFDFNHRRKMNYDDDDGLRRPYPFDVPSAIRTPDYWSRSGATNCYDPSVTLVNASEVFYAYNYPNAYSSNTGDERSSSVNIFLIMDTAGDVYMIMTIDAANDGSGGYLQLDMDATGGIGMTFDPVKFMGPPHDHLLNGDSTDSRDGYTAQTATMEHPYQSSWALYQNASLSFGWDACCNDGMIFGPFPRTQWSLNMKVVTQETRGIEDIRVGTYDSDKNDVGYLSIPIKRATATYGGIQLDGMDCTDYCQRYQDCSECGRQESCQFAPQNGGCVSAAAYVYDFGCPRPQFRPLTKLLTRNDAAFFASATSTTMTRRRSCELRWTASTCRVHATRSTVSRWLSTTPPCRLSKRWRTFIRASTTGTPSSTYPTWSTTRITTCTRLSVSSRAPSAVTTAHRSR